MIKILAISGIVITAITITIFMAQGPCDLYRPPPQPVVPKKDQPISKLFKDFSCTIQDLLSISQKDPSATSSASLTPKVEHNKQHSNISAILKFNSRDEARATGLRIESFVYKDHPVKKFNPFLPIKVELESGGNILWQGVIDQKDCNDNAEIPYCEMTSFKNNPAWWKGSLTLTAYDKDDRKITELIYGSKEGKD